MAKSPGKKKEKSKGPKKGASEKKAKGPSKSKDDKKKKGKKEKKGPLSKKDMDIAKLQKQKEEQEALQREAEEKAAAEKKLAIELKERDGQLAQSSAIIESYNRWVVAKWKAFRACRNIPDFNKLYEVNSYISYWLSQLSPPAMKRLLKLTPEYLQQLLQFQLLYELQFYLIDPEISMRPDLLKELGILYRGMIDNQITYVNKCTYNIIADLSVLYEPEVGICDYLLSIPDITHCLWGNIYCAPNINGHEFEELKFKFKIPEVLLSTPGIYRLIKSEYDHYSDSCLSYFPPGVENALKQSILDWVELHKLASGEYTELQSPAELKKKKRKDKKKKKGKGGKKRAKSPKGPKEKKGKKKRKSKERSGSEDTGAATTGDEDDFKLISERESSATVKSKKKKSKKKAKGEGKDKSGTKKGKKNRGQDNADTDTSANTTTEPESEAEEEEESFSMSSFMAKARKTLTEITRRQSVRPDRTSLEERTSIEEREQEEQLKLKLEESYKKAVKGSKKKQKKKKKKSRDSEVSESEGNEEEEAEDVEKIESGNAGEVTSSTADDGNTTTAPESDDVSTSESRSASKEKKPKGSSKPGSAKSDKSVSKSKSDSGRSKSKSPKGDDRKSRSKTKDKSGKGKGKSKSKSRSKSGGSKKSKKKGGKSKSKDRHKKTEAELAKERERAEKSKFIPQLQENELNLRNYVILGGVYQFNLLEIPPQPKNRGNWVIHIKEADNSLKEVAFEADYTPPAIADQESAKKTPEEMEREAKQQEEELQKLVLADMSAPKVALWFEPPTPGKFICTFLVFSMHL
ncbi:neurofilament heavy polypeptide-like [Folsomia candida]|uniref:neurofilament heavy polypeptide-like n=1 Tax=Folsomia candida TaxID=158441 RepID=UPI0016053659|nr:neurofilament heavy polypeptide-like [Folsomia candida]